MMKNLPSYHAMRATVLLLFIAAFCFNQSSLAESLQPHAALPTIIQFSASQPAVRLSTWLQTQAAEKNNYPAGLSWRVPSEIPRQASLRADILQTLDAMPSSANNTGLRDWLAQLPITGRVPIASSDAQWLSINPQFDPVLKSGHSIVLPSQPTTVTVLGMTDKPCQVTHRSAHHVMDYINACAPDHDAAVDWVWIAQPDGKVRRLGVANWNFTTQEEAAPGAWIWAPARNAHWSENFSIKLAEFLASQEAAADVGNSATLDATTAPPPLLTRYESNKQTVLGNDWGEAGLLQTPSARMRDAGDASVNVNRTAPYTYMNFFLQPFDWLETGFRYTSVSNRLYGATIAGSQAYKDKSFDAKFRLMQESAWLPQVALGIRDLVGTGLFSGEYLVASKRTGDFDWNIGLGWGYVGNRGNLKNPLSIFSSSMDTRPAVVVGQGGNFSFNSYFRGSAALFGGVQYQTPLDDLILKLEYDGNNYQREPLGIVLKQSSPINIGADYKMAEGMHVNVGFERGNTATVGLTLQLPLDKTYMPKLRDPAPLPILVARPQALPNWTTTSADFTRQTQWSVHRIEQHESTLHVTVDEASASYWQQQLDRGIAVLHRDAPAEINTFTVDYRDHGMAIAEHHVDRETWANQQIQPLPPSQQITSTVTREPNQTTTLSPVFVNNRSPFENHIGPGLISTMGSANGFLLYQLQLVDNASWRFTDNTWLEGGLHLGLIDNLSKYTFSANSNLPRVRTDIPKFMTTSKIMMPNMQLTHTDQLGANQFVSVYAGYLEEMFAGAGGEWLYRPHLSPYALGVDVNAVRLRDFHQNFALQNYQTITGHATLYWDTGWNNVQAMLSAGRYLAKDQGMSLELRRRFDNGVSIGAGLTRTNVPAVQFGEGSFDKWIRVTIPFDALLPYSDGTDTTFTWQPLVRDGGAKLNRAVSLYDLTKLRDKRALETVPAPLTNDFLPVANQHD